MKKIALITSAAWSELTDDDRLLVPALRRCGLDAVPVVWDSAVKWDQFDHVILRSCWDYHLRAPAFLEWIGELERLGVPLHNSPGLVRWNADKTYLLQLEHAGARIPATVWIGDGEEANVQRILERQGWRSAVVKPTVSASAHGLKRIFLGDPVVRVPGPAMVQEFIDEIATQGEWSLVLIRGEFSHAVLKLPPAGEFRVQSEFGGTTRIAEPGREIRDAANKIFESLPERPLYARIDGIEDENGLLLMEVELIEPVLFLGLGCAATRFAESIAELPAPSKH